jgi:hypothetical protein
MVMDNGLVLLILLPQDTEIPAVPVNMGFDGSVDTEETRATNSKLQSIPSLQLVENDWREGTRIHISGPSSYSFL